MNILSYTYCLNRVYKPTNYVNAKISKYIYIYTCEGSKKDRYLYRNIFIIRFFLILILIQESIWINKLKIFF